MITTFAKLRAPIAGLGKANVRFSKGFNKLDPDRRIIILQQVMKQLRDEYEKAEREYRIDFIKEDARNADLICGNAQV